MTAALRKTQSVRFGGNQVVGGANTAALNCSVGAANPAQQQQEAPDADQFWGVNVYVPPRKRVHRRRFCLAVLAAVRMLLKTRCGGTPLLKTEKIMTARLYYSVPPMISYPSVTETLSLARLAVGVDDIIRYLARAGYHPGSTVTYRQFELLMMQLKKQYQEGKLIPDSEVAFVALGGGDEGNDRGGEVQADQLRSVCTTFKLTIDIDKFIADNDEDGSGLLEFDEFDNMFKAVAAASESKAAGDGGGDLHGSSQNIMRAVSAVMSMKALKAPPRRGSQDVLDDTVMRGEEESDPEEDTEAGRKKDNETVIEGSNRWAENPPPALRTIKKKKPEHHRSEDSSVPSTAEGSNRQSTTRGSKRRSSSKKAARPPPPKKRALWESGRESEGKEERARNKVAEGPTFGGSARRWRTDKILEPLPPAKGAANPVPKRSHPRDREVDVVALVEKLRKEDESRASMQSYSARRAHSRNNTADGTGHRDSSSRCQTARTGTAASQGSTLPPLKPQSPAHSKKPKRWYSYNPFDPDSNEGGDPSEDPLTEGGYSKDRQKDRLPGIKRKKKKPLNEQSDAEDSDDNGMGGEKEANSDLDGSDSDAAYSDDNGEGKEEGSSGSEEEEERNSSNSNTQRQQQQSETASVQKDSAEASKRSEKTVERDSPRRSPTPDEKQEEVEEKEQKPAGQDQEEHSKTAESEVADDDKQDSPSQEEARTSDSPANDGDARESKPGDPDAGSKNSEPSANKEAEERPPWEDDEPAAAKQEEKQPQEEETAAAQGTSAAADHNNTSSPKQEDASHKSSANEAQAEEESAATAKGEKEETPAPQEEPKKEDDDDGLPW